MLLVVMVLAAALVGSLIVNYRSYQISKQYEMFFSANLLDPFNLNSYPSSSQVAAVSNERLVVFFGDSRALEWPAPANTAEWQFINRGINAQTSVQAAGRYEHHIAALQPDVIVVQVGVNDLRLIPLFPEKRDRIIANAKRYIDDIVAQALENGATVVLSTIFPVGRPSLEQKLTGESVEVITAVREVNQYIRSLASDQVKVLEADRILGDATGSIVRVEYHEDFLHINKRGYAVLNQELVRILSTVN
ncbi:MAG: GDSL-type esterase/lipase family protein [Chloroflexota bacterium]